MKLATLIFGLFFISFGLCQVETIVMLQENVATWSYINSANYELFAYNQVNPDAQIQVLVAVNSSVGGAQITAKIQACSLPNQNFLIYAPNPAATCSASLNTGSWYEKSFLFSLNLF